MPNQKGFADVNGTRLYYEVAGSGYPLVLIHGFACDTSYWDDQFEAFAKTYKVIRYDRRSFGQSANPTEPSYFPVNDLKALLEHLGISRAHIMAHSSGCNIAVDFALTYSNMISALFPVSGVCNGFNWPQEIGEEVSKVFDAAFKKAQKYGARAANETLLQVPILKASMENADVAPRLSQIMLNYPGWEWFNEDAATPMNPPAVERLDQIKAPTCIIVGEKEFEGIFLGAQFMHEHIPNAEMIVIPNAGHAVNMETPRQFNESVLRFLAKV